jgi:uracil-DNA glycosylase
MSKDSVNIEPSWKEHLQEEFNKPYFETLSSFVRNEYKDTTVYPPPAFIFRAFELCPFDS